MDNLVSVGYTDQAAGFVRCTNRSTGAGAAGYFLALEGATNANVGPLLDGLPTYSVIPAGSAQYSLCNTTAVLNFVTAVGSGIQVVVPAPVVGMFGPDGVTVDPTSIPAGNLIATVLGYLTDGNGNTATAYTGGVKSSRKVEQVSG